jgi:anti-anti-sigma factor
VKVEGKGSFQTSPALRDFSRAMIGQGFREFVIDLGNCPVMDSTFMGTLAGIASQLRSPDGGCVRVIRPNERNSDLLQGLGLDKLLQVSRSANGGCGGAKEALDLSVDKVAQAETMLEAHEALVDVEPGNLVKFKDVLEYLRQDLGRGA